MSEVLMINAHETKAYKKKADLATFASTTTAATKKRTLLGDISTMDVFAKAPCTG